MLQVCNVCLPSSAYKAANESGASLSQDSPQLVDLEFRHVNADTLEVWIAASEEPTVAQLNAATPFQSVCTVQDANTASGTTEKWTRIARFSDMPNATVCPTNKSINAAGSLAVPGGLCHPHLHLDKCYLLDRCEIKEGTFDEAMSQTGEAKGEFSSKDLVQRGRRLLSSSVSHGVTTIRAHVEVDPTVNLMCLEAGIELQSEFAPLCDVQLVAFAQDPLFYPDDLAKERNMAELMDKAASNPKTSAVGSAPYVEPADGDKQIERQKHNIDMIFDLAERYGKDIDFHIDYDLELDTESLVHYVLELAAKRTWTAHARQRRIALGHCTKLSQFTSSQLANLGTLLDALPSDDAAVSFVGLPPSDVYMQGRSTPYATRPRATLPLLALPERCNAALGVNNVANLFTPQGDADPLALLPNAVALWGDATQSSRLLQYVTSNARFAAGSVSTYPHLWRDLTILDSAMSEQDAVLAPPFSRITIKDGILVSHRSTSSHVIQSR